MRVVDFLEDMAHFTFGLLSALSVVIHPILTVIAFLIFIFYELDQDFRLSDYAYQEIYQYGFGFGLGIVILLFFKILIYIIGA